MKKEFSRTDRLEDLLQRELAVLVQREIKDPRLTGMVTISTVKVTKDLAYAKVYFTVLGDKAEQKTALEVLNHAAGYMRSTLAKRIKVRKMPHLTFIYDKTLEYGQHLTDVIDKAIERDSTLKKEE